MPKHGTHHGGVERSIQGIETQMPKHKPSFGFMKMSWTQIKSSTLKMVFRVFCSESTKDGVTL